MGKEPGNLSALLSALFVGNTEIDKEAHRQYLARLGNLAHRYPIREEFWDKMEDISIEGAVLYTFGIAPDTIQLELEHCGYEDNSLDELPKEFPERLRIIKSAVRSGAIKCSSVGTTTPPACDDQTRILMSSFRQWHESIKGSWLPAPAIPDYPAFQPDAEVPSDEPSQDEKPTHNPLSTNGIAMMFKLDSNDENNNKIWKNFAKNAKRNGLNAARMQVVGGTGQSRFDPVKVADWLVDNGKIARNKANQILASNLSDPDDDRKHFFDS